MHTRKPFTDAERPDENDEFKRRVYFRRLANSSDLCKADVLPGDQLTDQGLGFGLRLGLRLRLGLGLGLRLGLGLGFRLGLGLGLIGGWSWS